MTCRWHVRAAMTEERSKAEIKNSALRRSDENQVLLPLPKNPSRKGCTLKDSFQKHGISRKRYAVFCICVHKCSASYALIKDNR